MIQYISYILKCQGKYILLIDEIFKQTDRTICVKLRFISNVYWMYISYIRLVISRILRYSRCFITVFKKQY